MSYQRLVLLVLLSGLAFVTPAEGQWTFVRGDANGDASVDVADAVYALTYLFSAGPSDCLDAIDTNDDGSLDVADPVTALSYLFSGGPSPSSPFPECGVDPTDDGVGCDGPLSGCGPESPPAIPQLDPHSQFTSDPTITVSGTLDFGTEVIVTTPVGQFTYPVTGGAFTATDIPLRLNALNTVYFSGSGFGQVSPPATSMIVQDGTPPVTVIQFPVAGATIVTGTVEVIGTVSDNLSGSHPITVTVNGNPAFVDEGIGTTGTFLYGGLPLVEGPNEISVTASDFLGNEVTVIRNVTRVIPDPASPTMEIVSGNLQVAEVQTFLPEPIVVRILNGDGTPFAGKLATFTVTLNDGIVNSDGSQPGTLTYQTVTDADGLAAAFWRLGTAAGEGINRVEVTSSGIVGASTFCATGTAAAPSQINIGDGNNQYVATSSPAPVPLRVWVSDGCNGIEGVTVHYSVVSGGGTLSAGSLTGQTDLLIDTFSGGYAEMTLTLGPNPGIQVVKVTIASQPSLSATFTMFGLDADPDSPTDFSGIVLDNGNLPISGATVHLTIATQTFEVFSDAEGAFEFSDIPAFGPGTLEVNGLTATMVGSEVVPVGSFPSISYQVVVVEHADNRLGRSVLLPRMKPVNSRVYDGTTDIQLTIEGVEGLVIDVPAGTTVTLPDGTVASSLTPVTLALNSVNHDDIPMPIPDGAAPPFAWTLQPSGTTFSPPLPITYPNMSGLAPGSIAYFLTYNHDNFRFEIVSAAQVSADGLLIQSDPGAGLVKAGWGCNCPPYAVAGDCENCNTECQDEGTLTAAGAATVSKECLCVGQSVTFTAPEVTDSGGDQLEECEGEEPTSVPIPAGTPTYMYEISRGGSVVASGSGQTVPYTAPTPGVYSCSWTVSVTRDCPPADITVGPVQATAVEITGLTVANAVATAGDPDCYVTTNDAPPTNVVITATINPVCSPVPADLITWTGGTAGATGLERLVPRGTVAATTVTAVCDNTEEVVIHVVDADALPGANPAATLAWVDGGAPVIGAGAFGLTVVTIGSQTVVAPTYMVTAYLDGNNWKFHVDSVSHTYLLGVHDLGRTDVTAGGAAVTTATLCAIETDLTPPGAGAGSGPPRGTYWSMANTQAHEECHVTRFYNAPYWSTEMVTWETAVEMESIPFDCADPATLTAAAVIASRTAAWDTSITARHVAADQAEIGGSEVACHGVSNPMYTALIAAIKPTVAPMTPTGVGAAAASTTSATVTWTDASCNETGFTVEQSSGGGAFVSAGAVGVGGTSFTATGLTTGTAYTFRVIANGAAPGGDSAASGTAVVTP